MRTTPVRLLVITPHSLIRAGIEAVLTPYGAQAVVVDGSVACGGGVDVALYDVGSDPCHDLAVRFAALQVPVVAFLPSEGPGTLDAALRAGAVAALSYDTGCEVLLGVVTAVAEGREPRAALARHGYGPLERARLSPREVEVLSLIAAGLSNAEVCRTLFLSINSVKTYVRSAYQKIGVTRRPQAVLWYLEATEARRGHTTPSPR